MSTRPKFILAAVLITVSTLALAGEDSAFDRLIAQILAQLEQQSESDQRIIAQTVALRQKLQAAENKLAANQFTVARDDAMLRDSLIAANEMIANPQRTKLLFDSFLRASLEHQEAILQNAIDGPAATRLSTTRLAAQTKARQAVLKDLRRDVESLRKFPTSKERLSFVVQNVQLIANAVAPATR